MDELARQFINRYQGGFPIEEQPFASIAAELDSDASSLIAMVQELLDEGVLSRFGPLYDASSMGGSITLAALSVPPERFDEIAELVNALPEVAHNYQREHELNMWFVLATETPERLQQTIDHIEQTANLPVYNFPKLQTFYLGLQLELDASGGVCTRPIPGPLKLGGMIIDELDRSIVQATQEGLPLQKAPYTEVAASCGCDTNTVLRHMRRMLERGVIRRIGAVPNHYKLGLRGNGMSVWDVDDERLQELGARVGRLDFVSHCYERPRHLPRWPYNLFAMVHGHDRDEVTEKLPEIATLLGSACRQHEVLFSTRILKKTGLRLVD
ncbi:MAG: AsnC family transcriptional regulator [Gammaproteobacteria bacterium]|nr:MAG: Lrp/AsnC family transcriptional regulator [Gammaproteobacteria bacterium]UCH40317.1 MAG: AsnC family transcriptional regulator [Gammaproteobacteria bacterium]